MDVFVDDFKNGSGNWGFRCVNHVVYGEGTDGAVLHANNAGDQSIQPSVFRDVSGLPAGQMLNFSVDLANHPSVDRGWTLAIWELGDGPNVNTSIGFRYADTAFRRFEVSRKKERSGSVVRCEVYFDEIGDTASDIRVDNARLNAIWASASFPIVIHKEDTVGHHWYMRTHVTVSGNGLLVGMTEVESCQIEGFHGGVWLGLFDQNSDFIYVMDPERYGVNGKNPITGHCTSRSEPWQRNVSAEIMSKVCGAVILQYHAPGDPIENLNRAIEIVKNGVGVFK